MNAPDTAKKAAAGRLSSHKTKMLPVSNPHPDLCR